MLLSVLLICFPTYGGNEYYNEFSNTVKKLSKCSENYCVDGVYEYNNHPLVILYRLNKDENLEGINKFIEMQDVLTNIVEPHYLKIQNYSLQNGTLNLGSKDQWIISIFTEYKDSTLITTYEGFNSESYQEKNPASIKNRQVKVLDRLIH